MSTLINQGDAHWMALCQSITAQSPLPLVITAGPQHTIQRGSVAFADLLGSTPARLQGQMLADCLHAMGADHVVPLLEQVYTTSAPYVLRDQDHIHPQYGDVCWTYAFWPIVDETEAVLGVLLEVQDTTHQRWAGRMIQETQAINEQLVFAGLREQALAEQLQRQLALVSAITRSLGEGVYAVDQHCIVNYVNPAAERMLGYEATELLGCHASADLLPQLSRTGHPGIGRDRVLEVVLTGTSYRADDGWAQHQQGQRFPISYTIAPIRDDGTIVGAVVIFRDLSEIRRLEQAREEYLTLLSHDLRTPLTSMLLSAELLLRALRVCGTERDQTTAQAIIDNGKRINSMINDVLEQSVLETGSAALQREPLDLAALTWRMVKQLPAGEQSRIRLEASAAAYIYGDAVRVERVVGNLLSNALKYSDAARPVFVKVFGTPQQVCISVRDQGVGIDAADMAHLFEKHYRAQTAGKIKGLGLGLYSSKLIMTAHGGQLWAESEVGHGSIFVAAFPILEPS